MRRKICKFLFKALRKIKSGVNTVLFKYMTGNESAKGLRIEGDVGFKARSIKVGNNVKIFNNVVFWGDGDIVIGDNVHIGNNTIIYASANGGVTIGNDVSIAANCYIIDTNHGIARDKKINAQANSSEKIVIGNDVWLAAATMVLKGSVIPDGVVVGANSLVNGELEPYGVYVGSPVRKIKDRV